MPTAIIDWKNFTTFCLAACLALLSAGCTMDLEGRSNQYSKYDKEKDEYHFLWATANIRASRNPIDSGARKLTAEQHRQVGLGHLENLWKGRQNIVMMPGPFGPIAFIRRENRLLETVSLFLVEEKSNKFTTNFDLTPIRVQPGEMLLGANGTLSYTHHCVFPGKTIDQAFALALHEINPEVSKTSQARLDARKKEEQKRIAWKDLRTELWNGISQGQRFGLASKVLERFPEALSDESLELLVAQGKKQGITLARDEMKFTVVMQLSPGDAKEFCDAMEAALRGELPPGNGDPAGAMKKLEAKAIEAFRASKAATDASGKVTITVELISIFALLEDDGGPWGFMRESNISPKQLTEAKDDAAEVERRKIPVNRQLKLEKIVEDFRGAGKK